eukprot:CAMPEP_0172486138 /NCGR_PEP_ID=MMETSP1066-20121228/14576_1 /TAXON_ID=671091 /ORGANISM="Coscinodiscus wailesii, Strain CCMP2513" /LENGTH=493 /DNA_ID=CAMNT_0013251895 /DNA_START=65 /DNA_END=1549 /DNA_ORIENTATION=-
MTTTTISCECIQCDQRSAAFIDHKCRSNDDMNNPKDNKQDNGIGKNLTNLFENQSTRSTLETIIISSRDNSLPCGCLYLKHVLIHLNTLKHYFTHTVTERDLLEQDNCGDTPLHMAIECGNECVINLLLASCPKATAVQNSNGDTPLHHAIQWQNHHSIVLKLLIANANVISVRNNESKTPLDIFFKNWNLAVRSAFLKHDVAISGAQFNSSPSNLFTTAIESDGLTVDMNYILNYTLLLLQAHAYGTGEYFPLMTIQEALEVCLTIPCCPWVFFHMICRMYPNVALNADTYGNYLLHTATLAVGVKDTEMYVCRECDKMIKDGMWYQNPLSVDNHYCGKCYEDMKEEDRPRLDGEDYVVWEDVDKIPRCIETILDTAPNMASLPNGEGRLPFHLILSKPKIIDVDITRKIFQACPVALSTRDPIMHLYPFMLLAVHCSQDIIEEDDALNVTPLRNKEKMRLDVFDLCYELLIEDPTLVSIGIPIRGCKRTID